jgi:hypothetical protein
MGAASAVAHDAEVHGAFLWQARRDAGLHRSHVPAELPPAVRRRDRLPPKLVHLHHALPRACRPRQRRLDGAAPPHETVAIHHAPYSGSLPPCDDSMQPVSLTPSAPNHAPRRRQGRRATRTSRRRKSSAVVDARPPEGATPPRETAALSLPTRRARPRHRRRRQCCRCCRSRR